MLVSGSDDFTMFLWKPNESKKPIAQMTGMSHCVELPWSCLLYMKYAGHQQLINEVLFSPDGRTIASASFDKSVKLWNGKTGK